MTTRKTTIAGLALPNVTMLMTGVRAIEKVGESVRLVYVDGSRESCHWPELELNEDSDAFNIIGTVQERARQQPV